MTPELLTKAARCLYDRDKWRTALSRDLHVSERTVRRWVTAGAPDHYIPEIVRLLRVRKTDTSETILLLETVPRKERR